MRETFGLSEEKINKMIGTLASLPPVKKQPIITTCTETCACGHIVPVVKLKCIDTGVFKTIGDVCSGCKEGAKLDNETSKIVCAGCKRVLLRIKPATDKTGFCFKPGKTYHVAACSLCDPELKEFPIIEKVLWDRSHAQ